MEGLLLIWYHKPTFSGRYLNFHFQHPLAQKRSVIYDIVDKIFSIFSLQFHQKNMKFIIQTLLKNGYPLNFIFSTINRRLIYTLTQKFWKWYTARDTTVPLNIVNTYTHTHAHTRARARACTYILLTRQKI